eukprot:TRINITY_DN998_c0_g1_i2.p1 TRINITY_DN998_c0_g1~~TRINITY_DN998_c0_g1_i2.p1  ORF type:complete len:156 (-),score=59.45 TRINITY_DN998_c0_g1_i2:84-551(-)
MRSSLALPYSLLATFLLSSLPSYTEGTFEIIIPGIITLTAAQVTLLAALKVLGVSAGLLLSRPKRDVAENLIGDTSLVTLTSRLEPEDCFQLLFCTLATEKVKIDQDVENIHKLVISKPGKYREAHKFGQTGRLCSLRYQCSMKVEDIVTFYQNY